MLPSEASLSEVQPSGHRLSKCGSYVDLCSLQCLGQPHFSNHLAGDLRVQRLDPSYSQSPFKPMHTAIENGNENGNGSSYGHGVFVSDGWVLPPLGKMEPEEGYAF